jgi:hypothetical protein
MPNEQLSGKVLYYQDLQKFWRIYLALFIVVLILMAVLFPPTVFTPRAIALLILGMLGAGSGWLITKHGMVLAFRLGYPPGYSRFAAWRVFFASPEEMAINSKTYWTGSAARVTGIVLVIVGLYLLLQFGHSIFGK